MDIIVVPSIGDPRNTVTSLAMFQNAFDIKPPIPIVVIYGTCTDSYKALGENGKKISNWEPKWNNSRFNELRTRFRGISEADLVPIYFFDDEAQRTIWIELEKCTTSNLLPDDVTQDIFTKSINDIFGATYSYGAQRNKGFIVASMLNADNVFFFDDDTFLAPNVGNIIDRYRGLLKRHKVYAVTGGYFGQRAFNVTIFRKIETQQEFLSLLGEEIPDDQATLDLWAWRLADGVLGGNFCIKSQVYKEVCCPSMDRTPTTDDKLIGREIRRVFGSQSKIYKTGWPVVHAHFPTRMNPDEIRLYLKSWAKTKAFWVLYNGKSDNNQAAQVVFNFGKNLLKLGQREAKQSPGTIANAIIEAAKDIMNYRTVMVNTVNNEMERFNNLKKCWPSIITCTAGKNIWIPGQNKFP